MMKPSNLLYIISDQHTRRMTGCYGHSVVQTPNMGRLAEQGTIFTNAYTNCPICVPARASLATGRYVHQIGNWDNGFPYEGYLPSWGHRLQEQGYRADSIGKLHFRGPNDANGFVEEVEPLHVVEGIGDILSSIREGAPIRRGRKGILEAGPGDSTYLQYDARNGDHTCHWLKAHRNDEKPWVLFASFVCPHPPYISPPDLHGRYPLDALPLPPQWQPADWPTHPAIAHFRQAFDWAEPFTEAQIRNLTAAYYGACTYLDHQIGRVLDALKELGLSDSTRVIYTSDHGESLGARGLFGKFTMYEEAVAVPFIMTGPDVPAGNTVNTPISLVDSFPTILEVVGAEQIDDDLPGQSLWQIAQAEDQDRTVFSEYHAVGTRNGNFMLRNQQYKYIYYVGDPPQLFDLIADPDEVNDLATSPDHQSTLHKFEAELRTMLNPEMTDALAKADQQAKVNAFGGREAVIQRGAFTNSPVPGEKPQFR